MPKRPATPPPGDDEPRYLTVCYPYPPHANMEIDKEVVALARWLVCCMGRSEDLYAIYHKPSASNMVLIEVNRQYPNFRRVLGAHKWSQFVHKPGVHKDKVTRIYFSSLANVRAVEKAGWKRIFINDDWFRDFIPNNQYIAYPYPLSSYCDPPSEDHTSYKLCRPIPKSLFEIPMPIPPPVPVGSSTWITQKEEDTVVSPQRRSYTTTSILPPGIEPRRSQLVRISPPDVFRPASAASSLSNASNSPLSHINADSEEAESGGSSDYLTGYYRNGSSHEEDYGTHTVRVDTSPATAEKAPICPVHEVICKKGVCTVYASLLKDIAKKKKAESEGSSFVNRGFQKGRARGAGRGRVRGGKGGGRGASYANNASSPSKATTRGRGSHSAARGLTFPPRGNLWIRGASKRIRDATVAVESA